MLDTLIKREDPVEVNLLKKQWLEYSELYLTPNSLADNSSTIFKELNGALSHKSFITGNSSTEVDEIIFKRLYDQMAKLSFYEKEQYIHLSRWFCIMQSKLLSPEKSILFSRSLLYGGIKV